VLRGCVIGDWWYKYHGIGVNEILANLPLTKKIIYLLEYSIDLTLSLNPTDIPQILPFKLTTVYHYI
jgi:hypothetical protein